MMFHKAIKLSKSVTTLARLRSTTCHKPYFLSSPHPSPSSSSSSSFSLQPLRSLHDQIDCQNVNPVALQMIDYARSLAKSQNSDESYAQGMLVLQQCLSTHASEDQLNQNTSGMVLLAMSDLSYERGSFGEAIEHLQKILNLTKSSLGVKAAAMEALVGLNIQLEQDDTSSLFVDKFLDMLESDEAKNSYGAVISARAKALKGFVELVHGNIVSAESFFRGLEDKEGCTGNVALSCGQYLHATQNFSSAKALYQKVIRELTDKKESSDVNSIEACNMTFNEVLLAATFALGQLESHMGNYSDAEEILTKALTKAEEYFGSHHPKVGVVLTGIALMFRQKSRQERSSSFLVQEGLYRRALQFLKAPAIDSEATGTEVERRDIVALARGGYAELLCVQENRKSEGDKMKKWAEAAWGNHRMSLAAALTPTDEIPVVDSRTSRVL